MKSSLHIRSLIILFEMNEATSLSHYNSPFQIERKSKKLQNVDIDSKKTKKIKKQKQKTKQKRKRNGV